MLAPTVAPAGESAPVFAPAPAPSSVVLPCPCALEKGTYNVTISNLAGEQDTSRFFIFLVWFFFDWKCNSLIHGLTRLCLFADVLKDLANCPLDMTAGSGCPSGNYG